MIQLKGRCPRQRGKQKAELKEKTLMFKTRIQSILAMLGLLGILASQNLLAHTCPTDASDTGVAVLMAAFRINPDGTTGPAVVGPIGICECIRLRMLIRYTTPGPSGGKVSFFEGGTMTIRTASGSFID